MNQTLTTDKALTETEKQAIREKAMKTYMDPELAKGIAEREIYSTSCAVRDFANTTERVKWTLRIVHDLTDRAFPLPRIESATTVEKIRDDFDKWMTERLADEIAEFNEAPWGTKAPTAETCPLDPTEAAACRKVFAFTPYQIWRVVKSVEEAAMDAMRDNLMEMVGAVEDGTAVGRAALRTYEKALRDLRSGAL